MKRERLKFAKLANFKHSKTLRNRELGQLRQLFCDALVGLEDSTAPYEFWTEHRSRFGTRFNLLKMKRKRLKFAKLANFKHAKSLQKWELGQLRQLCGGLRDSLCLMFVKSGEVG